MSMFAAGGFPMVFVLLFGLVACGSAARFALQPVEGRHRPIAAYGLAVLLVSVAGTAVDLVAVANTINATPELRAELALVAIVGFGEALSPIILGFSLAGAAALLVAIGLRRLPS